MVRVDVVLKGAAIDVLRGMVGGERADEEDDKVAIPLLGTCAVASRTPDVEAADVEAADVVAADFVPLRAVRAKLDSNIDRSMF